MADSGLIAPVGLVILLFLGVGRVSLILALILAINGAAQERPRADSRFGRGYPQATGPLAVTSGPPVEASLRYRLWQLDSLRRSGVISFDEYVFARRAALAGDRPLSGSGTT